MDCAERGLLDALRRASATPRGCCARSGVIGAREGLGDLLGEGSRRAAAAARRRRALALHVKGLELPGYEPRALQTMALGLAVGARGADHNRSGAYEADFSGGPTARRGEAAAPRARPRTARRSSTR